MQRNSPPLAVGSPGVHIRRMEQALRTRIRLTVNGEGRDLAEGSTVHDLLADIGLAARKVAVERNREIVPRSLYATTALAEGDALEIVHFIGGG